VIDLSDYTVLPGLIDMHVHLLGQSSPASYLQRYTLNPADLALKGTLYARRTLEAGFTTVRDVGGEATASRALRDAIRRGDVSGPRMFIATQSLASTGGHGDPSNGLNRRLSWQPTAADGVVNSVDDAKQAVRQRYKDGADLIKITATGGVLSMASSGQNAQFSVEEITAIVETAKDYGFMVAAHAHGTEGIKRAILGGVTTIEHGTFMDAEALELMKEHGTYLVPTISAGRFVAEKAQIDGYFPEVVRPKAASIGPVSQKNFDRAYKAGVNIVFGTDCGVCPHGSNAKEFLYMVEGGMPPMEAIQAATAVPARLLGIDDETGTLEPGKHADLIAVERDPLRDITVLQEVAFVMKGGDVYKRIP
jgi:imidazolonepropionase-like amidohydrolase